MRNVCNVLSAMASCDSRLVGAFRQLKRGQAIYEKDGTTERRIEAMNALRGRLTVEAVDEEVEVSTTPLKRRKTIAQAGPTGKEEREQKKVFQAPKPKRKHREARPDDAPPVVAPPMVDNTPEAPPVINPNAGNTLDAMSQARQRARNRGGKPDEQ